MGRKDPRQKKRQISEFADALIDEASRIIETQLGAAKPASRQAAIDIAWAICGRFAKTLMYVPEELELELTARDRQIWSDYGQSGPNDTKPYSFDRIQQLTAQYSLGIHQIYKSCGSCAAWR